MNIKSAIARDVSLQSAWTGEDRSALRQQVGALFVAHRDAVFRQVLRILSNPGEAEDLTQEAFLRLYSELQEKGGMKNPRAWVFRTAHNLAIDRYRASRSLCPMECTEAAAAIEFLPDPGEQVEESLLSREKKERVAGLLAGLSPQERRCMELRTEGLRYREIAEILRVRITTVEANLSRAVKKIMENLDV